jgi:hypothetical protein
MKKSKKTKLLLQIEIHSDIIFGITGRTGYTIMINFWEEGLRKPYAYNKYN